MSLHDDLLEQAKRLIALDARRPKQSSLRRAVSTAYYALFHLLVSEATSMLVRDEELHNLVSRAFVHSEMKTASKSFANMSLPKEIKEVWSGTIPKELQDVAETFVELQEDRHKADYKLNHRLRKSEVSQVVSRVEKAFQDWAAVKTLPIARIYLASLVFSKKWKHDEK